MMTGTIIIVQHTNTNHHANEEAQIPKTPSIIESIHTTMEHIRINSGRWFYMRGAKIFLVHDFAKHAVLPYLIPTFGENAFGHLFFSVVSAVTLVSLQVAWVHAVIAKPSPVSRYRYIARFECWTRALPIVLLEVVGRWLVFHTTLILQRELLLSVGITALHEDNLFDMEKPPFHSTPKQDTWHLILAASLIPKIAEEFIIAIPARIIFTRIAASMLDDTDEPIIPLDRSLRNTANHRMGMWDAWKSRDGALPARVYGIQVRAFVVAGVVSCLMKVFCSDVREGASFALLWFNA